MGVELLSGLRPSQHAPNVWTDGQIYDPTSGRTYRAALSQDSPRRLLLRGYLGIQLLAAPPRGSGWEEKASVKVQADVSSLPAAPGLRRADSRDRLRSRHPEELHRWGERTHAGLCGIDRSRMCDVSRGCPARAARGPRMKPELIARQSRRPHGWLGEIVARVMSLETDSVNRRAVDRLALAPGESVLEVGCGHGRTLQKLLRGAARMAAGIDPSDVMFRLALRRLRLEIREGRSDVRLAEAAPAVRKSLLRRCSRSARGLLLARSAGRVCRDPPCPPIRGPPARRLPSSRREDRRGSPMFRVCAPLDRGDHNAACQRWL